MPSKKKKYNARFPAGRIKKIMQTDEEVGKVAQAVPVIISRTLELFVESLLTKAMQITSAKNAKTLSPSHMKQCILSEQRFDFLKDLVKSVQDNSNGEDDGMAAAAAVSTGTSLLTPAPHRSVSERRKSSSSSVKQEATVVKEELVIRDVKREATVVKEELVIKDEPVESPKSGLNCSTLSQGFYSAGRAAEPTASIHPLLAPSPPASPSPILVMDEDYDT